MKTVEDIEFHGGMVRVEVIDNGYLDLTLLHWGEKRAHIGLDPEDAKTLLAFLSRHYGSPT